MKIKKASNDFKETDLPSNRIEMFKDCLKVRYGELLKTGLVSFIFFVPILLIMLMKTVGLSNILSSGEGTAEEIAISSYTTVFIFDLLMVIASIVAALGIAGLTRVIRQIAWGEPLFFTKDFFDGIKLNGKFIVGATFFLSFTYAMSDVLMYSPASMPALIKTLPTGALIIMIIPLYLYNLSQVNVYDITLVKGTKNSCILYIKSAPKTLLFVLTIIVISCIKYISYFLISLGILSLLLIAVLPIFYLAWFLFSCTTLDKVININYYPEIVDKGIHRKPGYVQLQPTIPTKSVEELQKEIDEENAILEEEIVDAKKDE